MGQQWSAAEEVADSGDLHDDRQQRAGPEDCSCDERSAAGHGDGLSELGADERNQGRGGGLSGQAGRSGQQPGRGSGTGGGGRSSCRVLRVGRGLRARAPRAGNRRGAASCATVAGQSITENAASAARLP